MAVYIELMRVNFVQECRTEVTEDIDKVRIYNIYNIIYIYISYMCWLFIILCKSKVFSPFKFKSTSFPMRTRFTKRIAKIPWIKNGKKQHMTLAVAMQQK